MKFTRDLADANDLVQDTIIKAIRYHHLYKPDTNLRAWLYTIMRNTFINDYRKQGRRNSVVEIADELKIPIGTVKTRIHVARKVLKCSLKMYNDKLL